MSVDVVSCGVVWWCGVCGVCCVVLCCVGRILPFVYRVEGVEILQDRRTQVRTRKV